MNVHVAGEHSLSLIYLSACLSTSCPEASLASLQERQPVLVIMSKGLESIPASPCMCAWWHS